ncbi:Uncharacterised protein [Bordetella ansorpii]|uniref:Uncharacterized protein n=1 Tax=Bordetella ansorpii TaxID=288768 RepID=A0A157SXR2_9BORD|nr:Uncharacterised protein [Bordetella ansorpii]
MAECIRDAAQPMPRMEDSRLDQAAHVLLEHRGAMRGRGGKQWRIHFESDRRDELRGITRAIDAA